MPKVERITEQHVTTIRGDRVRYQLEIARTPDDTRLQGIVDYKGNRKVIPQTPPDETGAIETLRVLADITVAELYRELNPDQ